MLCDKDDCIEAVRFITSAWLEEMLSRLYVQDEVWILLGAVSFLDGDKIFRRITKDTVFYSVEDFLSRPLDDDDAYTFPTLELHGRSLCNPMNSAVHLVNL